MFKKVAHAFLAALISFLALAPVSTAFAVGPNLVNNASVETAAGSLPANWNQDKWGTNTASFTYKADEGHTGTKSLMVNMTKYTSGDAKWYFAHIPVKPSTKYTYSEFYKSNVATETDVEFLSTTNKYTYKYLNSPTASATTWKQQTASFTTPASVKTLTVFHVINKVGWLQTDDFSLTEDNGTTTTPTPPTVTLTAPTNGATISNSQAVSASASDKIGMAGVQFKVDGANLGAEDTTAPYSVNWDTKTASNGNHTVTAVARNTSNLTTTTSATVNVQNSVVQPTPPMVNITSPATGSMVSGSTVALSANASDATGVAGVQFKIDNANVGSEDTTSPYSVNWDSTAVSNGNHTLTAIARNTSGLTATTSATFSVNNTVVTPPPINLVPNSSVETSSGFVPTNWLPSNWGTNTTSFNYLSSGAHTGARAVRADITSYTNGAANWYYSDIPVTAGKTYKYENWYQSNVDTEVDAQVTMTDGSVQYFWLGSVPANTAWTKFSATFTAPTGARSMAIYQILAKVGYLTTDDYSLNEYTPTGFSRALVSVTFDDGWANQYTNGLPIMQQYGLNATYYIISGEINDTPDYMSANQILDLKNKGHEIGSHTITHPDLTTLTQAQVTNQMQQSQTTLQNLIGLPVTNFAYPYGAYNSTTINIGKQFYRSQRSVDGGLNSKDNWNITALKIHEVDSNISQQQVYDWINEAINQKAWLILVYHEIATNPVDPSDELYTTQSADLNNEMAYLKFTGVTVKTVNQALDEIIPQL